MRRIECPFCLSELFLQEDASPGDVFGCPYCHGNFLLEAGFFTGLSRSYHRGLTSPGGGRIAGVGRAIGYAVRYLASKAKILGRSLSRGYAAYKTPSSSAPVPGTPQMIKSDIDPRIVGIALDEAIDLYWDAGMSLEQIKRELFAKGCDPYHIQETFLILAEAIQRFDSDMSSSEVKDILYNTIE